MDDFSEAWVHPTAIVEPGVVLGGGTRVWDCAHLRRGARVGRSCIVGEKTYLAYDVEVGDYVKLNASVYLCAGVALEDFVMVAAHVVFTNDVFPRAGDPDLRTLASSQPTEETLSTRVCRGATVGANATIGPGLTLGAYCMVGMGAVVTRDVAPYALVVGAPARRVGWVCACGRRVPDEVAAGRPVGCVRCGRGYVLEGAALRPAAVAG